jgi:hypothetical protein
MVKDGEGVSAEAAAGGYGHRFGGRHSYGGIESISPLKKDIDSGGGRQGRR